MTAMIMIVCVVGITYLIYQSNQATTPVAKEHDIPIPEGGIEAIEYFWRPGCPFCMRLTSGLTSANIAVNARNIWENPDDAAIVRSIADGNETVPTVIIGPVAMVNPSIGQVKEALAEHAPHLL